MLESCPCVVAIGAVAGIECIREGEDRVEEHLGVWRVHHGPQAAGRASLPSLLINNARLPKSIKPAVEGRLRDAWQRLEQFVLGRRPTQKLEEQGDRDRIESFKQL